jgi:hypothetical protein
MRDRRPALMPRLRCTACDRRFDRPDVVRSDYKCPSCGGLALFDWTDEDQQTDGNHPSGLRRRLGRWRRRTTG